MTAALRSERGVQEDAMTVTISLLSSHVHEHGALWIHSAYRRRPNPHRFAVQSTRRLPSRAFNPRSCLEQRSLNLASSGKLSGSCESSTGAVSELHGLAGLFLCPRTVKKLYKTLAGHLDKRASRLLAEKKQVRVTDKRVGL